jgi:hypothetical protein
MLKSERLQHYKDNGFQHVEGWCGYQLFDTIDLLDDIMPGKAGGCLEIGVHHGKFFLLMNQVIGANEKSYAVDVFDRQDLNIDTSGKGSLEAFKANLLKYDAHQGRNTTIIPGDSTDAGLRLEERIGPGSMRFISIDGGHTAEHTLSDLHLATRLVRNEGVVIVDDILNAHWLGVIEGVGRFLSTVPTLVPFATGDNKLYLSKLSFYRYYFERFRDSALKTKVTRFYGHDLVAM